jgi:Chaperone of endosialidase
MAVTYTFATATSSIPLSQLDANFATPITLGNTAVYLGNTTPSIGNLTLSNVTITSGTINASVTESYGNANAVVYTSSSNVGTTSTALSFDGTNFSTTGTATATKFIPTGSSVTGNGLYLPAANSLGLSTNGTNALYIDSSQNVGIGTTGTTSAKLNIGSPVANQSSNLSTLDSATLSITNALSTALNQSAKLIFIPQSGGIATIASQYENYIGSGSTSTNLIFANQTSGSNNATEKMRIDSSGNVGIGTSSPSSYGGKLVVANGVASISNTSNANVAAAQFDYDGTGARFFAYNSTGSYQIFYTNASSGNVTERMRIDSSGNLLVGTTTSGGVGISLQPGTVGAPVMTFNKSYNGGAGVLNCNYNGANVGGISMTNSATAFNTTSDYRLKENIIPLPNALDTVMKLKPSQYSWKENGYTTTGFIAHELQAVVPDCVTGEKDAVDAEGKPIYQGVDTSFLVATLTAAIQEQQTIINDLKARITILEGAK